MKNFVVLFLCVGLLAFTSCSREASIAEESSSADLKVSDVRGTSNNITVDSQCNNFVITVTGCGSGLVLKYAIYDLAGNWVDGARLTMSGNSHTTNAVLASGTTYRVVVQAAPCGGYDDQNTTLFHC